MARKGAASKVTVLRVAEPASPPPPEPQGSQLLNELAGVGAILVAVFALISFFSYVPDQVADNYGGPIGYGLAMVFVQTLGLAAYALPVLLAALGIQLIRADLADLSVSRGAAILIVVLNLSIFLGLLLQGSPITSAGGWLGGFLATVLRDSSGSVGAYVIACGMILVALMFLTGGSLRSASVALAGRVAAARTSWKEEGELPDNVIVLKDVVERRREDRPQAEPAAARSGPVIFLAERTAVDTAKARKRAATQEVMRFANESGYTTPPLSKLDTPRQIGNPVDEDALRKSSEVLEAKLANFDIDGHVEAVRPGPVITTFEITPAPGVKVARIVALQDDLALALRATSVRILAPIPGKPVVGIEVANAKREKVFLKEILESDAYVQSESHLTLVLGKDSSGTPMVADLMRMPHLLLAGATGTGKSVALNAMIMSILFKAAPRDVRFVMIDLKMLELSLYENMPHLLVPVIIDPKKAVIALKNLCEVMDERYRLLRDKGVRNIDGYNKAIAKESAAGDVIELRQVVREGDAMPLEQEFQHEHMPKIVVIIDELADLMMTGGRVAEESITRLAQKARACGIHLILATQRPSVDVITGLIKANFPTRISMQVTSRADSRTILDGIGAERLLGGGDMLYLPPGTARAQRLHGAYVSEAEISAVTDFVRSQGQPHYFMELMEGGDDEESGGLPEDDFNDEMYDLAVKVVTETRQASISSLQRKLRVGYNRAARMIERMEREGVVGANLNGKRDVIARSLSEDEEE